MNRPQEVEAKLLAVARPVTGLWRALAALRELNGHGLEPLADQHISDRYFDTGDNALRRADLALRVREADHGCTMAIKGKSSTCGNVVTRLEFERPCGPDGLGEIWAELREHGVVLSPFATTAVSEPGDLLADTGLVVWQARTTQRQRRAIRLAAHTPVTAELALDECRYRIGAGWLSHYEVEIESMSGDAEAVATLSTALQHRFAAQLRPWPHSKLATGAALTALVAERGLNAVVDEEATVRPEIYAEIERWLRKRPHP